MSTLNLTQHPASPEQRRVGVVDLPAHERGQILALLTFDELPGAAEISERVKNIAHIASMCQAGEDRADDGMLDAALDDGSFALRAMIGGAPWLMAPLESALRRYGIEPVYAFSRRESVETVSADGTVRKESAFRHVGFVRAGTH